MRSTRASVVAKNLALRDSSRTRNGYVLDTDTERINDCFLTFSHMFDFSLTRIRTRMRTRTNGCPALPSIEQLLSSCYCFSNCCVSIVRVGPPSLCRGSVGLLLTLLEEISAISEVSPPPSFRSSLPSVLASFLSPVGLNLIHSYW